MPSVGLKLPKAHPPKAFARGLPLFDPYFARLVLAVSLLQKFLPQVLVGLDLGQQGYQSSMNSRNVLTKLSQVRRSVLMKRQRGSVYHRWYVDVGGIPQLLQDQPYGIFSQARLRSACGQDMTLGGVKI